jgi:phosphatidylglycerophosphatase A
MNSLKLALGTLFGIGRLPVAPGTWGSLATLPIVFLVGWYAGIYAIAVLVLISCILSLWCSPAAEKKFGEDPSQFILDELAGQSLVFLLADFSAAPLQVTLVLLSGFILFRFFDIIKPLGINALQKLPGKFGILADDILAGFYALLILETGTTLILGLA